MSENEVFDVIIIGGGAAACSAAIYAVRAGLKTVLVTDTFGGQLMLTNGIENYPGIIEDTGFGIASKFEKHAKSYKELNAREGYKVKKIMQKDKFFLVETEKPETIKGKTVIIATGKKPRRLEVKGAKELENKGIHYCAICDAPLYKGKTVAVIGGGYAGTEEALYLAGIMEKVYLIHIGSELNGEEIALKEVLQKAKQGKIEIFYNTETTEVLGREKIEALKLRDLKSGKEKEIRVSAAFVQIGQTPNTEFIDFARKNRENEIVIDENNMSSVKGVFAAGDVSDIKVKQLVVSAAEGAKAALRAAKYLKENKF